MTVTTQSRSVGDMAGFIQLLQSACSDPKINATLADLLVLPDQQRQALVQAWVTEMLTQGAPKSLIEAIACLQDDAVAEKAYEVIFQCRR